MATVFSVSPLLRVVVVITPTTAENALAGLMERGFS